MKPHGVTSRQAIGGLLRWVLVRVDPHHGQWQCDGCGIWMPRHSGHNCPGRITEMTSQRKAIIVTDGGNNRIEHGRLDLELGEPTEHLHRSAKGSFKWAESASMTINGHRFTAADCIDPDCPDR